MGAVSPNRRITAEGPSSICSLPHHTRITRASVLQRQPHPYFSRRPERGSQPIDLFQDSTSEIDNMSASALPGFGRSRALRLSNLATVAHRRRRPLCQPWQHRFTGTNVRLLAPVMSTNHSSWVPPGGIARLQRTDRANPTWHGDIRGHGWGEDRKERGRQLERPIDTVCMIQSQ